jgi:signal transduction histidine kinase
MMGRRPYGNLLVVLDGRLEMESARQLLVISSLVGLAAYLLLSAGAVLLIRRMTKPVQESFDKQKQFVMDASHELKTPLAVISANSEALAGKIGENRWLNYIQSEVQRTDQLVKNLLTLARMDQAGQQLEKHPFDLSWAVLSVTLPFESMAFETGKTMVTDVTPNLLYNGNEEMLKQMAVILIDNALKYANDGGTVTVSLLARGERRILRVHNTSEGIKQEHLPRVFERFYRADEAHSREKEGNRLGLAIAKTIVTAHKGKITAESEPGHWACFTVTL